MATLTSTTHAIHVPLLSKQAIAPQKTHSPSTSRTGTVHRGPVNASLNFYGPPADGSLPYNYVETPPPDMPRTNVIIDPHEILINDARNHESSFNLDTHAFALLKDRPHNPAIDWDSDDSIREVYYPEVEKLLLEQCPGATRILLFDHTIRRASPNAHRAPVTRAHIDQTPKSAAQRLGVHLSPSEAALAQQNRYRIINVWRPINGAVESFPLAFADSTTVEDGDMVGVEHRYPSRTGETAGVQWNRGQKWWYWSGVEDGERVLLQCFDSASPGNRVPHSAFVDPRSGEHAKGRESIEVRALILG